MSKEERDRFKLKNLREEQKQSKEALESKKKLLLTNNTEMDLYTLQCEKRGMAKLIRKLASLERQIDKLQQLKLF